MGNDLGSALQDTVVDLLAPLREAAGDPELLADWLATLGQTATISGDPALLEIAGHAQALITKLAGFDPAALKTWTGVLAVLEAGRELSAILAELRQFAADPNRAQAAQGLAEDIMSLMLAGYLRRRHPVLFRIASLLTLVDARENAPVEQPIVANGIIVRNSRILDRFNFALLNNFFSDPGSTFKDVYFPNGMSAGADAWQAAARLFPILSLLADELGLSWRTENQPDAPAVVSSPDPDPAEAMLPPVKVADDDPEFSPAPPVPDAFFAGQQPSFQLALVEADPSIALGISASSRQHAGAVAGFIVSTIGNFNQTETNGQWKLTCSASGTIPAFAINADGISLLPTGSAGPGGSAKLVLEHVPTAGASGPAFVVGSADGTRLELGNLSFTVDLAYDSQLTAAVGLAATSGALVIAAGDSDGFLGSILPANGLRTTFDLGLTWSSDKGFALKGGAGLDVSVPVGLSLAGVTLSTLHLGLQTGSGGLTGEISASLAAAIGPVDAVLDRVGIAAALSFPQAGGNLGTADLDVSLKPPSGAGLSIDANGVFTGGGFLQHDPTTGTYSGAMQLSLHDAFTLTGYGLITTKMPDGSRGFSLLVFIAAEDFKPVPLGFGFMLQSIGGMLGINRTFDADVIRAGLHSDTLASLLLPHDPVGNAPALMQALAAAFPAQQGSYLLGLLARITWFEPALVQMDLALILELGTRTRLLALGRVSALLPSSDNDLIRLIMDVLGVLDFDAGTMAADAVLVDSRLAHRFPITGSAALRGRWAGAGDAGASFVLAVGGLNPRFTPPDGFPALERVAIALCSGNNPRLICDAYFAVTADTVQFGSRTSLYAEALGFNISGDLGYDALITLLPPHFIVDFHAAMQLKRGSHNLFKVTLDGTLEGPLPLQLAAKATFEILWISFSVHFNFTLAAGDPAQPPASTAALADELTKALADPSSWSTRRAPGLAHGVALRSLPPGAAFVLDPLGQLVVQQTVVPLNTDRDVDTFGGAPVAGPRRFQLAANLNGSAGTPVTAAFAPARYFTMSDDDKLAAPSFELMDAGLVMGSEAAVFDATTIVPAPLAYESIVLDTPAATPQSAAPKAAATPPLYTLPLAALQIQLPSGAAALAPVRRVGRARYRNAAVAPSATMQPIRWNIVKTSDGSVAPPDPSLTTWSETRAALATLNRGGAGWLLVPAHELHA